MGSLLVLILVGAAIGAAGDGYRGARRMLASLFGSPARSRNNRRGSAQAAGQAKRVAIIFVVLGVVLALATLFSRNVAVATIAAILLGIGLPQLVVGIYKGIGIAQPPLYAWVLVVGMIISPFGFLEWYGAAIVAEVIVAGLLLLWFDRKDKILDTYEGASANTAEEKYRRLRRTAIVMIGLVATIVVTVVASQFVWIWLIAAGAAAAFFMVRKIQAMRKAKAEAAAEREAEVERILGTKIPGLDLDANDEELLRKYANDVKTSATIALKKGERRPLAPGELEVRLTGTSSGSDIDCYVFLLDARGRTRSDDDLIFFGQTSSPNGAVKIVEGQAGTGVDVQLGQVPQDVERIEVVFGLGEDAPPRATWTGGTVTVQNGDTIYTYPIAADGKTRMVDVLRVYRHNGKWKLWLMDRRTIQGVSVLCGEYGINVA